MNNNVLFYDTETTGFFSSKKEYNDEKQPHLVQLAAILADSKTSQVIQSFDIIIKPDGWVIPEVTSKIHGITTERAMEVGISEKMAVGMLYRMCGDARRVAHNKSFDKGIIGVALSRYAGDESLKRWIRDDDHECTMELSKPIMQIPLKSGRGIKNPKLSEAYTHFTGKILENAHTAIADTKACMEVYWAIQDKAGV